MPRVDASRGKAARIWQDVAGQNTNAILGIPPEPEGIKTPIASPGTGFCSVVYPQLAGRGLVGFPVADIQLENAIGVGTRDGDLRRIALRRRHSASRKVESN